VIATDQLKEFHFDGELDRHRRDRLARTCSALAKLNVSHSDLSAKRLRRDGYVATAKVKMGPAIAERVLFFESGA